MCEVLGNDIYTLEFLIKLYNCHSDMSKREENQVARKLNAFHSPKPEHRPDKKQRRQIIKFKQQ